MYQALFSPPVYESLGTTRLTNQLFKSHFVIRRTQLLYVIHASVVFV